MELTGFYAIDIDIIALLLVSFCNYGRDIAASLVSLVFQAIDLEFDDDIYLAMPMLRHHKSVFNWPNLYCFYRVES